ncbi:hypothetical protein LSH36_623g02006 [Paralvinella palmiformis]|uniref:G-protein coupled receptors family 1 profile domain-containing protein n=1 Tax=Paralvinella palmiformis TaxID=53620 RepID=A0AAD9J500_9ANNE|nr:hypothetical protein LSH36_623g02006 [Paralvinella palmiformis]
MNEQVGLKHITLPVLSVLMVFGNGMLIFVIGRHKTLWTVTNFFVLSLALSDFLLGLFIVPLLVAAEEGVLGQSPHICLRVFSVAIAQTLISCLTLMAIALERYLAITRPLQHHAFLTTRNAFVIILCCWIYCIAVGALPWLGWNALGGQNLSETMPANGSLARPWLCRYHTVVTGSYVAFMYPGHFVPLWIVMLILYAQIYLRSRHHVPKDKARRMSISLTTFAKKGGAFIRRSSSWRLKENWRALRILAVVVGYFVLSWLPVVVWYCMLYKGFTINSAVGVQPSLPYWFYNIGISLAFGNSAVNPFLYGLGNRSVRRVWLQCCCRARSRKAKLRSGLLLQVNRRPKNGTLVRPLVERQTTNDDLTSTTTGAT